MRNLLYRGYSIQNNKLPLQAQFALAAAIGYFVRQ
jgi:hypothetical protein